MLKASEMRKAFYNSVDKKKVDNIIKNALTELEKNAKEGCNYVITILDTQAEVNYVKNELRPLRYCIKESEGSLSNGHTIAISFYV